MSGPEGPSGLKVRVLSLFERQTHWSSVMKSGTQSRLTFCPVLGQGEKGEVGKTGPRGVMVSE